MDEGVRAFVNISFSPSQMVKNRRQHFDVGSALSHIASRLFI